MAAIVINDRITVDSRKSPELYRRAIALQKRDERRAAEARAEGPRFRTNQFAGWMAR